MSERANARTWDGAAVIFGPMRFAHLGFWYAGKARSITSRERGHVESECGKLDAEMRLSIPYIRASPRRYPLQAMKPATKQIRMSLSIGQRLGLFCRPVIDPPA